MKNRRRAGTATNIVAAVALAVPVSQAPAQLADAPWPMFQHDPQHTGRSPYTGPSFPALRWVNDSVMGAFTSVAVGGDGSVYLGDEARLYGVRPDGTLLWSLPTAYMFHSSPALDADGTIYIGSSDINGPGANLYAMNADGTQKWVFPLVGNSYSHPTVGADGTIYVTAFNSGHGPGHLFAVNADGTAKWSIGGSTIGSPAIGADGTIYVGFDYAGLAAVNPDGTVKWTFASAAGNSSPTVAPDGTIYKVGVGSEDYPTPKNKLYAVNPDGTLKWAFMIGGEINFSTPALAADGTIYVGSTEAKLYAVNPDGTLKWTFATGYPFDYASPAVGADGTIYIGSDVLYALNPDGSLRWTFATGGYLNICSPAVGPDGTIFVGSAPNSGLYAIGGLPPKTVTAAIGPGGTVSTDSNNTGATPGDPVQATVTSPSGGTITITRSPTATEESGFTMLSGSIHIDAPPASSPSDPLVVTFELDAAVIPPGENQNTIRISKDGIGVPPCTGNPGEASPDPCVSMRTVLPGGNIEITVLTTTASDWQLGVPAVTTTTTAVTTTTTTTLPGCGSTPVSACQPAAPRKARLQLGNGKLSWKWTSSAVVATSDFGSPPTTTDYLLCVYDMSGMKMSAQAPADRMCGTKPCWKALGTAGFKYGDKAGTPDGLTKAVLKAGSAGRAKIQVKGAGTNLHLPTLPLTTSVRVQLQQGSSGACWEANYSTASTNTASTFKAKSD